MLAKIAHAHVRDVAVTPNGFGIIIAQLVDFLLCQGATLVSSNALTYKIETKKDILNTCAYTK